MRGSTIYVHGYDELKFEVRPFYQMFPNGALQIVQKDGPLKELYLNINSVKSRIAHKHMKAASYYRRFYDYTKVSHF